MEQSLLMVSIGDEMAALDAVEIQSVVELDHITPVPCSPGHVVGLAALRSKAMTVIDCRRSLGLPSPEAASEEVVSAVVVELDEYLYALIVDRVEEVVPFEGEPTSVSAKLLPGWTRAALGLVETSAGPALLLDPRELVAGPPERQAA